MKKTVAFLVLLTAAIGFSSCSKAAESGRIEIQFWHMNPVGSPGYSEMKRLVSDYNASQDRYTVKAVGFSFWDYWDKINIAISSKTTPDIGLGTIDDIVSRASNKILYNVSEMIRRDPPGSSIDLADFREGQLAFATWNGDLWAMPFTSTARALYYNIDMFAEKGISEDHVPKTWSELKRVAKLFDSVENGSIVRLGFDPTYGNATYHGWLWQCGLDFFDADLNPTLNRKGHLDVLKWILAFNNEFSRTQLASFGEANQMLGLNVFSAQKVAMIVDTDGLYQTIERSGASFSYGVAPIPIPDEGGRRVNWGSGFSLEMYDDGKRDAERKAGAWDFYKYLLSADSQIALADITGWIMSHRPAMKRYTQDKPILKELLGEVDYAVDKVYVPYAPSWHGNDWQPFYAQALSRKLTPEEALAAARKHYVQKRLNWEAISR